MVNGALPHALCCKPDAIVTKLGVCSNPARGIQPRDNPCVSRVPLWLGLGKGDGSGGICHQVFSQGGKKGEETVNDSGLDGG